MTKDEQKAFDELEAANAELAKENARLEKAKSSVVVGGRTEREKFNLAKGASVDYDVEVEATDKDKHHIPGERFKMGQKNAKLAEKKGWVKVIGKFTTILLFLFIAFHSHAQITERSGGGSFLLNMDNTLGTNITRDTVTNTGTGVLVTDRAITGFGNVTITVLVTKVSGTVAGAIVLTGSNDGSNYVAINTPGTQTAITTVAAVSDATARYTFNLASNQFRYYKLTHTGTGTMVSYLDAHIMKH